MISSAHEKVIWEADLPWQKSHYDLNWEGASIDEISIEQIWVLFGWASIYLENVEEIVVLAMNVSTDSDLFLVFSMNTY